MRVREVKSVKGKTGNNDHGVKALSLIHVFVYLCIPRFIDGEKMY